MPTFRIEIDLNNLGYAGVLDPHTHGTESVPERREQLMAMRRSIADVLNALSHELVDGAETKKLELPTSVPASIDGRCLGPESVCRAWLLRDLKETRLGRAVIYSWVAVWVAVAIGAIVLADRTPTSIRDLLPSLAIYICLSPILYKMLIDWLRRR